jgi:hypothetical protein
VCSSDLDSKYDIINVDIDGYLSTNKFELIRLINELRQAEYVSFTFSNLRIVRGPCGKPTSDAKIIKEKYKNSEFQTIDWLKDNLTNYIFLDKYEYKTNITLMGTINFKRIA